jgi:hypothetical protein
VSVACCQRMGTDSVSIRLSALRSIR